jgi:hypothetical protein
MSSSALVLASLVVTHVAAAAKWKFQEYKPPPAPAALDDLIREAESISAHPAPTSLLAESLSMLAEQGVSPEEAMAEAQKLLDADDQHDAALWRRGVLSFGGGEAAAAWNLKPQGLSEKGAGDEKADGGAQDGDYVLLLMQHDLQQLDLAQNTFSDALTTCEDAVKEVAPHVPLYDEWTNAHGGLVQTNDGGVQTTAAPVSTPDDAAGDSPDVMAGPVSFRGSFLGNQTAESAGSADGENVMRLMEHDMTVLQRAGNEYANSIGTMERTAAEVKKHETLYADFVKALNEHAEKSGKLTLGNSALPASEVQQLVAQIANATVFCEDAAQHAKTAQEDGTAPPVSRFLESITHLWRGATALVEKAAHPDRVMPALLEMQSLADPASAASKAAKARVYEKVVQEQREREGRSPDDLLTQDVDKADHIVSDVTSAERHMREKLDAIAPP